MHPELSETAAMGALLKGRGGKCDRFFLKMDPQKNITTRKLVQETRSSNLGRSKIEKTK